MNPNVPKPSLLHRRWILLGVLALATIAGRHLVDAHPEVAPDRPDAALDAFQMSDGLVDVRGHLDRRTVLVGGDGEVKLELLLAGADRITSASSAETDFVVVLDRSGSMAGEKIAQARAAALELLDRLSPRDRFALVSYSSDVRIDVPLATAEPGRVREWRRRVEGIEASGGTAMSLGLDRAIDLVAGPRRGPRRVVLLSDGLANEADSSLEGLQARATAIVAREAVLSAVGIGLDFDEQVMTALADRGAGNFYFLEAASQLASLFDAELGATRDTVAAGIEIAFEPAPGVRLLDAAGFPTSADGRRVRFRPGPLFAGQERRFWLTLRVPPELGEQPVGRFALTYRHADGLRELAEHDRLAVVAVVDPAAARDGIDRERWARSVVEEEYGALRQEVALLVKEGRREDALGAIDAYRAEKAELNATLRSAEVAANLDDVGALSDEVDEAFRGADQERKQKLLSKSNQAAGWDQRRVGSKKQPAPGGGR